MNNIEHYAIYNKKTGQLGRLIPEYDNDSIYYWLVFTDNGSCSLPDEREINWNEYNTMHVWNGNLNQALRIINSFNSIGDYDNCEISSPAIAPINELKKEDFLIKKITIYFE